MTNVIIANFTGKSPFRDARLEGGNMAILTLSARPQMTDTMTDTESHGINLDDPTAIARHILDYAARRCIAPGDITVTVTTDNTDNRPVADLIFLRSQVD